MKINGNILAQELKEKIKTDIKRHNQKITFSIVYVGQDSVIDNFIRYKKQFGEDVGVNVKVHRFEASISESDLLQHVNKINVESDAVIIQLPLPQHLDVHTILNTVSADKDVDVLSDDAKELFSHNIKAMYPPVTGAMVKVLESEKYTLHKKNILIVGFGNLVGKPFAMYLERENLPYTIIDKETDPVIKKQFLKQADCIISGAGVPGLIQASDIKEGVVLLDGGTSEAGKKIVGDIDPSCYKKSQFYTPVPGGIGPLTIAVLYENILKACQRII